MTPDGSLNVSALVSGLNHLESVRNYVSFFVRFSEEKTPDLGVFLGYNGKKGSTMHHTYISRFV